MKRERATKKQQELLQFIQDFLAEHDYSPSYREIMQALSYKSVSTVAVHVNGLVAKGYLERRENSARSLEVVSSTTTSVVSPVAPPSDAPTLTSAIEHELNAYAASDEAKRAMIQLLDAHELLYGAARTAELRSRWNDDQAETELA